MPRRCLRKSRSQRGKRGQGGKIGNCNTGDNGRSRQVRAQGRDSDKGPNPGQVRVTTALHHRRGDPAPRVEDLDKTRQHAGRHGVRRARREVRGQAGTNVGHHLNADTRCHGRPGSGYTAGRQGSEPGIRFHIEA